MMLVGEIGIPRREYLYELKFWEIMLITRGYFRRQHPAWEQARLVAYNARYCMGTKTPPPPPDKWLPFSWEQERRNADLPTDEEVEELENEIRALNNMKG